MLKNILFFLFLINLFSCSNNLEVKNNSNKTESILSTKNNLITELENDSKGNYFVSIFYSIKDKTTGDGEEINVVFKKENNKDIVSKIIFIQRLNTVIEEVSIKDINKIKDIISKIKKVEAKEDEDKENINTAIKLLEEIKD